MSAIAPTEAAPELLPPPPPLPQRDYPPPPPLPQRDFATLPQAAPESPPPAAPAELVPPPPSPSLQAANQGAVPDAPPPPLLPHLVPVAQASPSPAAVATAAAPVAMSLAPPTVQSAPPAAAAAIPVAAPATSAVVVPPVAAPVGEPATAPAAAVSKRPRTPFPVPISEDDLADELRPPGMVQSLGRSRPGGGWFAIAFIAVAAAFVGGVALGRGTAPRPVAKIAVPEAPPAPKAVEATPPPSPERQAASSADAPAVASPAASSASEPKVAATTKADGPPFNVKAASTNLGIAAARAHGCHMRGDPAGNVSASVTFANNGRVSDVTIAAPHTGTKTALCITYKLNTVRVPPYGGSPQTVTQAVTLK